MSISHVKVLTMPVSDQDRAKRFYAETLGFEVQADQTFGDNRWLQVAPKGAATSLVLAAGFPGLAPGSVNGVILVSTDLDGDCESLRRAGAVVEGPSEMQWGRQATVEDPDGNGIVLQDAANGS